MGLRLVAWLAAVGVTFATPHAPIVAGLSRRKVTVPTDHRSPQNASSPSSATSFEALRLERLLGGDQRAIARHLQDAVDLFGPFRQLAYFYADVYIGSPPQRFSVITDTGSSLTAVPCDSCTNCGTHMNPKFQPGASSTAVVVGCGDGCNGCTSSGQCRYSQGYAEGSSISGILYSDVAFLGDDVRKDAAARAPFTASAFTFGCQISEGGLFLTQKADGIMGIGQGGRSFIRTLWDQGKLARNMFSLCMGLEGGAMTFGDVYSAMHTGPVQWAAMTLTGFYVVFVEGATMEGTALPVGSFNSPGSTILDSGTTFTYLPPSTYSAIMGQLQATCSQAGRCKGTPTVVSGESLCFSLAGPADLATFPSLTWTLRQVPQGSEGGGSTPVTITMTPEHLFLNMGWDNGAYCLGIYQQSGAGAVLGANALMGYDVILDLGQSKDSAEPTRPTRVGFAPSRCNLAELPSPQPAALSPAPASPSAAPAASSSNGASISPSEAPASPAASVAASPSGAATSASSASASPAAAGAVPGESGETEPSSLPSANPTPSPAAAAVSAASVAGLHSDAELQAATNSARVAGAGIAIVVFLAIALLCCLCAACRKGGVSIGLCGSWQCALGPGAAAMPAADLPRAVQMTAARIGKAGKGAIAAAGRGAAGGRGKGSRPVGAPSASAAGYARAGAGAASAFDDDDDDDELDGDLSLGRIQATLNAAPAGQAGLSIGDSDGEGADGERGPEATVIAVAPGPASSPSAGAASASSGSCASRAAGSAAVTRFAAAAAAGSGRSAAKGSETSAGAPTAAFSQPRAGKSDKQPLAVADSKTSTTSGKASGGYRRQLEAAIQELESEGEEADD